MNEDKVFQDERDEDVAIEKATRAAPVVVNELREQLGDSHCATACIPLALSR